MIDIRSRLSFGMISSIIIHTLLIAYVLQLTMDQPEQEVIEVAFYGEGGGQGLVTGETTKMGEAAPSESAAWEQAQAGSPDGNPETDNVEVVKVPPVPTPVVAKEEAPKPVEVAQPIVETPKAEPKIETTAAEIPSVKPVKAAKPTVAQIKPQVAKAPAKVAKILEPEVSEDADTAAMIAAAQADFDKATADARDEMAAQKLAKTDLPQEAMATMNANSKQDRETSPPPSEDEVKQSLAAAQDALKNTGFHEDPAPQAVSQGESVAQGSAFKNSAPGDGGGGTDAGNGFVRSLSQLQQMPGNPAPHYDIEERLNRHEGVVIFHAYITPEGLPTDIKIVQRTGFRGLDKKAFAALTKWRFYPGQQGWVEVPFNWSLKGDAQEISPLSRRKVGENADY